MENFYPFVQRCFQVIKIISSTALDFWNWLFTVYDGGILGEIMPIELISFVLISAFLIIRIVKVVTPLA